MASRKMSDADEALLSAIFARNIKDLKKAIKAGANPNFIHQGAPGWMYCMVDKSETALAALLAAGADANFPANNKKSPLNFAIAAKRAKDCEALIRHGADLGSISLDEAIDLLALVPSKVAKKKAEGRIRELSSRMISQVADAPGRKAWVEAVEAGDIGAALKAQGNEREKPHTSPEFLPFPEQFGGGNPRDSLWLARKIPYLRASTIEAMLRAGNSEGFRRALEAWTAPERIWRRGSGNMLDDWASSLYGSVSALPAEMAHPKLITLAALRCDQVAFRSLIKAGLCPRSQSEWAGVADIVSRSLNEERDEQHADFFAIYGIDPSRLGESEGMLWEQEKMASNLVKAVGKSRYGKGGREEALRLLRDGASADMQALIVAARHSDIELLEALFDAGADPNWLRDGDPLLTDLIDEAPLDSLEVWIRRGACPFVDPDPGSPDFIDERGPIFNAIAKGRLDVVRLLLEQSVVRPSLHVKRGKKTTNPLADFADDQGFGEIADYLRSFSADSEAAELDRSLSPGKVSDRGGKRGAGGGL